MAGISSPHQAPPEPHVGRAAHLTPRSLGSAAPWASTSRENLLRVEMGTRPGAQPAALQPHPLALPHWVRSLLTIALCLRLCTHRAGSIYLESLPVWWQLAMFRPCCWSLSPLAKNPVCLNRTCSHGIG